MVDPEKFHKHLDVCDTCRNHPFALCADGVAALEAAAGVPSVPYFWRRESSGLLAPVVERYLRSEALSVQDLAIMRAYLRQWIAGEGFRGPAVERLRVTVEQITTDDSLAEWLAEAVDAGVDPL